MMRFTSLALLAALLTGCGVITQAAIIVGGQLLERPVQRLENPALALCDRPGAQAGRVVVAVAGELESTAEELADAEAAGDWPLRAFGVNTSEGD